MSLWVMSEYAPKEVFTGLEWYNPKKDEIYVPDIQDRVWRCANRVIAMKHGTIYKSDNGDIYELKKDRWIVVKFRSNPL